MKSFESTFLCDRRFGSQDDANLPTALARKLSWSYILTVALCFTPAQSAAAQAVFNNIPVSARCVEPNQRAIAQVKDGRLSEAEATLSLTSSSKTEGLDYACTGVVLNNIAAVMSGFGQLGEAIGFAERSIQAFQKGYSPDNPVFLRALAILVAARL